MSRLAIRAEHMVGAHFFADEDECSDCSRSDDDDELETELSLTESARVFSPTPASVRRVAQSIGFYVSEHDPSPITDSHEEAAAAAAEPDGEAASDEGDDDHDDGDNNDDGDDDDDDGNGTVI